MSVSHQKRLERLRRHMTKRGSDQPRFKHGFGFVATETVLVPYIESDETYMGYTDGIRVYISRGEDMQFQHDPQVKINTFKQGIKHFQNQTAAQIGERFADREPGQIHQLFIDRIKATISEEKNEIYSGRISTLSVINHDLTQKNYYTAYYHVDQARIQLDADSLELKS